MHRAVLAILAIILVSILPAISAANANASQENKIHVDMSTNKGTYLNFESIIVTYHVYSENGRVVSGGNGTWFFRYSSNGTVVANGTLDDSHGYFKINLKNYNISAGSGTSFSISIIYNYNGNAARTTSYVYVIGVNYFQFSVKVVPFPGGYYPGNYVGVEIFAPVGGLHVDYIHVSTPHYLWWNVTNLNLNYEGFGRFNFKIPESWAPKTTVNVTVQIAGVKEGTSFNVTMNYDIYMVVHHREEHILSGETIGIGIINTNSIRGSYFHFQILTKDGDRVLYERYTFDNVTVFTVPSNYSGYLFVVCDVFNNTGKIATLEKVEKVDYANLNVYFDRESYHSGDTFNVYVNMTSYVMKNPEFQYSVYGIYKDGNSNLLYRIITKNRSISVHVPDIAPVKYVVKVIAISGAFTVQSSSSIDFSNYIKIDANVISRSPYATGAFTPGENIEVAYQISGSFKYGVLYYGLGNSFYTNPGKMVIHGDKNGVFTVSIPQDANSGIYTFHIKLIYNGGEVEKDVMLFVDSSPPWSQYLIFTVPAGDFLTIMVVLSSAIFVVIYVKYSPEKHKGTKDKRVENDKEQKSK